MNGGGQDRRRPVPPGPLKTRRERPPQPRFSTHKQRSRWFQMLESWPRREVPALAVVRAREAAGKLPPVPELGAWQMIGPTNIGGRLTCLICHPQDPDVVWAGAAGGGVWKSDDAGRRWRLVWDDKADTLNIGALALDPKDPSHLYCGTGEANLSVDLHAGVGLYESTDAGETWRLLAAVADGDMPPRIGAIAVDPFDRSHLLVGGVSFEELPDDAGLGGLYESWDAGCTWARHTFVAERNHWCHSVIFHPERQGTVFATFTERGAKSGIWRSRDGGQCWEHLTTGLPSPERIDRTSLAIAASQPDVIYALAGDRRGLVLGVFRSDDGGDSWFDASGDHFRPGERGAEEYLSYGNSIAVHPENPDHVLCGGVDLHRTTDGGWTWRRVTDYTLEPGDTGYAHADHHAIVFPTRPAGRVYDANDGGVDVSEDGGLTWANRSADLAVTTYYDLDVAPSNGAVYGGGTQDTGTLMTLTGRHDDHFEILGGDGGWMVFDPQDETHFFASSQYLDLNRFRDHVGVQAAPDAESDERFSVFIARIAMNPLNTDVVFTGTRRIWRSKDDGASWAPVSGDLDGSVITAIEVAPADPRRVYAGTENGGFFRSDDGGERWTENLAGATLPGRTITRIETNPRAADVLVLTVANFGHRHVFRSEDGGRSWWDIDGGALPDAPFHAVAIPDVEPETIYVCGDAGVFVSTDLGHTWYDLTGNLPHAMLVDLVHHERDRALFVATHGRSLWRLDLR